MRCQPKYSPSSRSSSSPTQKHSTNVWHTHTHTQCALVNSNRVPARAPHSRRDLSMLLRVVFCVVSAVCIRMCIIINPTAVQFINPISKLSPSQPVHRHIYDATLHSPLPHTTYLPHTTSSTNTHTTPYYKAIEFGRSSQACVRGRSQPTTTIPPALTAYPDRRVFDRLIVAVIVHRVRSASLLHSNTLHNNNYGENTRNEVKLFMTFLGCCYCAN